MAPHILVVSQTARLHIFTLYTSSYCENYRLKNSQGSLTDHNLLIHILTRALKLDACLHLACRSTSAGSTRGNAKGRALHWDPAEHLCLFHLCCCPFDSFHGMHAACHVDFWRNQMSFRGVYVCSKTVRRLILKWIYVYHGQMDFLFRNNTSHPAWWMASALNIHPCISNPPSHAGEVKQPSNTTQLKDVLSDLQSGLWRWIWEEVQALICWLSHPCWDYENDSVQVQHDLSNYLLTWYAKQLLGPQKEKNIH